MSGSTAQHGPRFKRLRPGSFKMEDTLMVDDVIVDEINNVEIGCGAADSGATKSVMGEVTWQAWCELLASKNLLNKVKTEVCSRKFRFGSGQVLTAKKMVTLDIHLHGTQQKITVYIVLGSTPLLISRPDMESWGMVIDFRNKRAKMVDDPDQKWFPLKQSEKGHFILNDHPRRTVT